MFGKWKRTDSDREVTKPPPGDCEARLGELSSLFTLLDTVDAFRKAMSTAIAAFEAAPSPLLFHLQQSYPAGTPGSDLVAELSDCIKPCVQRLQEGRRTLEALQEVCQRFDTDNVKIHELLATRKQSWTSKVLCDEKADELRRRFGPSFTMEEKRARLKAQHEADEAFTKSTQAVAQAIDACVAEKPKSTGEMLEQVRKTYAALWDGAYRAGPSPSAAADASIPSATADTLPPDSGRVAVPEAGEAQPQAPVARADASLPTLLQADALHAGGVGEHLSFVKGERIQVWSNAEKAWLEGLVEDVFASAATDGGFTVPAGAVKVSHSSGKKYVRKEAVDTTLRKWGVEA